MIPPASVHSDEHSSDETANEIPDVAQPEVDLLNIMPRSSSNNNNNSTNIPPKQASFDLLGGFETSEAQGNSAMPDILSETPAKSGGLDDIFGAFGPTNSVPSSNIPDLNSMGLNFNATKSTTSGNNVTFDPFGNESSFVPNEGLLKPTSSETSPSQARQPPTSTPQTSKDPFADMANLASGLNLNWGSQSNAPKATASPSPQTTQFSSPTHQYGGFVPNQNTQPTPTMQQARSPMDSQPQPKPDYSRTHFDAKAKQNGGNNASNAAPSAAPPSGVTGDIFADILGQQGYNFATKPQGGPRSINEMRKEELVKDMDPDKLRIMEWVSENVDTELERMMVIVNFR